tara:strand:- start:812 stop:1960 length:1149 start_codon:yes stop_codon:yes gene_type:complete
MEKEMLIETGEGKIPKSWHPQQEKILKKWSEIGSSYRYLHDKAFNKYDRCNMCFSLPVIILSTLTGVANFAQSSFPVESRPLVSVIVGSLNIIAGLITTIAQFLKVAEKMEGHRSASVSYSKFSRNISVELSLPVKERLVNGTDFLSTQRSELDRLIEQSPNIPSDIVNGFDKVFTKRDNSGNKIDDETTFYKPEILDIRPVAIYEKTKEEREEEDKAKRVEELKWNKQLKDMVIQDDNKRRGEIYNDVVKQLRDAHDIQQNPVMPVKDETEPDSIVLEMSNIMKELNMNELNDLGYDIEKDELVDTPFKSTVDITEEVKQDNAATIPEESTPLEKKPDTAIPEEVDDGEEEVVVEESPPVVDLSDNDVSGNNVILGKIDIE